MLFLRGSVTLGCLSSNRMVLISYLFVVLFYAITGLLFPKLTDDKSTTSGGIAGIIITNHRLDYIGKRLEYLPEPSSRRPAVSPTFERPVSSLLRQVYYFHITIQLPLGHEPIGNCDITQKSAEHRRGVEPIQVRPFEAKQPIPIIITRPRGNRAFPSGV